MKLKLKKDERGELIEVFKISGVGQVNYLTLKPGAIRGNHYHRRKKERFCVIEGEAKLSLRNRENNEKKEHHLLGNDPQVVDAPINWTHNIENIGKGELKLLVWVDEVFNPDDPDAYAEEV